MTSAASGIVHVVDGVGGLGGRRVVRLRAHAADARGDLRHLLDGAALEELLEAAQLRDDEEGVVDVRRESSRNRSMRPWPSRRVMGSMLMRVTSAPPLRDRRFALGQGPRSRA